jgi:hypothetical protein
MALVMLAFILQYAYNGVPNGAQAEHLFLFDDQLIYRHPYWDYMFKALGNLIFVGIIFNYIPELEKVKDYAVSIFALYIVDYWLYYNNPFYGWLAYGHIASLGLFILFLYFQFRKRDL